MSGMRKFASSLNQGRAVIEVRMNFEEKRDKEDGQNFHKYVTYELMPHESDSTLTAEQVNLTTRN